MEWTIQFTRLLITFKSYYEPNMFYLICYIIKDFDAIFSLSFIKQRVVFSFFYILTLNFKNNDFERLLVIKGDSDMARNKAHSSN